MQEPTMDAMADASGGGGVRSSGDGAASGDGTAEATNQAMPNPWGAPTPSASAASTIPMVGGGSGVGAGANPFAHASCGRTGRFEPARDERSLGCRGCQPFRCRRLRHQGDDSSGDGGGEHAIIVRLRRRNVISTTAGRETARTAQAQRRAHRSQVQPFQLFEQQQR